MFDKLEDLLIRYQEIMNELSEPGVADNPQRFKKLMKEQSDLAPLVEAYTEYKKANQDIEDSLLQAFGKEPRKHTPHQTNVHTHSGLAAHPHYHTHE